MGAHVSGTIARFCGSCVYCQRGEEDKCLNLTSNAGTICEYVIWHKDQVVILPETIPFSIGCLLEPVAVVNEAFFKLDLKEKDSICIFGGDFNGLILLQLAKKAGANLDPDMIGKLVADAIGGNNKVFMNQARALYGNVDKLTEGATVDIARLKLFADE